VRLLCRGLLTNRTLRRLSLASTGLHADGALEVASVVNSPIGVLESVDLSGNDIGLVGLRALSVSAQYSKTLKELILCNCGLSSRLAGVSAGAAAAIANALLNGGKDGARAAIAADAADADSGSGDAVQPASAFDALGRALANPHCALGRVDLDGNAVRFVRASGIDGRNVSPLSTHTHKYTTCVDPLPDPYPLRWLARTDDGRRRSRSLASRHCRQRRESRQI
jgi:hypothetical protein